MVLERFICLQQIKTFFYVFEIVSTHMQQTLTKQHRSDSVCACAPNKKRYI